MQEAESQVEKQSNPPIAPEHRTPAKPRIESSNFFKMSGMPKFGKQWLDNFIADGDLQNTFLSSEVVRNIVMLQCIFFASIFNDLIIYKQAFLIQKEQSARSSRREEEKI